MPIPAAAARVAYFAYGSNLDADQMRRRCPGARRLGTAMLRGYVLEFCGHSRRWGGGVANVRPARAGLVRGVVYSLTRDDLAALDRFEGHPWQYVRRRVRVAHDGGRVRQAVAYVMNAANRAPSAPSDAYLDVLRQAYAALSFDEQGLRRAVRRSMG
jgi:gamma-glutamylcyclotransferase